MKTLWRLLILFRPYWRWMLLGGLLSLVTILSSIGLMAVSGWFIAAMALAGLAGVSMDYFTPAAMIRGFAIARTLGRYLERLVTHEATFRLLASLRAWFYDHLEPLAPARLQAFRSGDLLSRIRADIDTLDNFYLRILAPSVVALVVVAVVVAVLTIWSPHVALSTLILLIVAGVVLPALMHLLGRRPGERIVETEAELRTTAVDGVQGLSELLVYGAAPRQAERMGSLSRDLARDQLRMGRLQGLAVGGVGLSANLALWLAALLAIPLVGAGSLAPPDLAMLVLLVQASFEAVMPLPQAFQLMGQTLAAARRLFELVDAEPAVRPPVHPLPLPERFDLEFQNVGLRYAEDAAPALADVSFQLPEGSRIAVVGPTGAGKSSLSNLLLRFWEYQQGHVLLGGQELRDFDPEMLRSRIAVVSQGTHLFNTTIRENLMLANPDADQAALEAACRAARIHDFIADQPQGYDTYVGEAGLRLSGGQARRVAIARALLKNAPLLVLDEPTEGLDARTEREVLDALQPLMAGRSVLMITHRLIGLEAFDRILVMEAGRIVESGTHAELIAAGGRYAALRGLGSGAEPVPA
ncbi:MAG: thiol reductant ABC exporter subunit CydC [Gammaproteobacteria bacterium]